MSPVVQLIALLCATALIAGLAIHTLLVVRATKVYRHLAPDLEGCGVLNFSGCSILCSRPSNIHHIKTILGSGYDRYEVIVVWDSRIDNELLNSTIRHFKMIRVNPPLTEELHSPHIRALYRSRCRCFRRLVVIDAERGRHYDNLNAAAMVASYDYLLPLGTGCRLRQGAIETIAVTLTNLADKRVDLLRSTVDGCCIVRREALIDAGGFSPTLNRKFSIKTKYSLALPLLYLSPKMLRREVFRGFVAMGVLIGLALISASPILQVAFIAAAVASLTIARYLALIVVEKESIRHTMYNIGHSISFFLKRVFFV